MMPDPKNRLREPSPVPPPTSAPVIGLLADGRIVINTTLNDKESVDDLIAKLNALRIIAPDRPRADPPNHADDPPGQHASVSLIITQAQKEQLRERGYTDEEIREMKPQDAHRVLGLVN